MVFLADLTRFSDLSALITEQNINNPPPFDEDSDTESEDAYDLREVSSDVEMNPDELDSDARYARTQHIARYIGLSIIC